MLIKTEIDINKIKSVLRMVRLTIKMVESIDHETFTSNVTKEYYEIIREMMSALLLLDGFRTLGEGVHKEIIEYISNNYQEFTAKELETIDDMRITRNKIAYDGFFVTPDYLRRNKELIFGIINKLNIILEKKMR